MKKAHDKKKPNFFFQGLLIVLPAILLAVLGIVSLRQDKILVEHDAAVEAKKACDSLVLSALPTVLRSESISAEEVEKFRALPTGGIEDPVNAYLKGPVPRIAFLIGPNAELLYPPAANAWPAPEILDINALSPEQKTLWDTCLSETFVRRDTEKAILAHEHFLDSLPPPRFAAIAHDQCAVLSAKAGKLEESLAHLSTVVTQYPDVRSEDGFSCSLRAQIQMLRLLARWPHLPEGADWALPSFPGTRSIGNRSTTGDLIASICSQSIVHPTPQTSRILAETEEFERVLAEIVPTRTARSRSEYGAGAGAQWRAVWEAHEKARSFYGEDFKGNGTWRPYSWLKDTLDQTWFMMEELSGSNRWVFALKGEDVREVIRRTMDSSALPEYFGWTVELSGKVIMDTVTPVGSVVGQLAGSTGIGGIGSIAVLPPILASSEISPFKVSARLIRPEVLYARQRTRTIWFGLLIAASTLAVLAGFWNASRAFRRQQHLSEMKSNFVSSVSHELRAPIASVRLMAEELEDLGPLDREKGKQYHQFIVQECRRLSSLIENVLDFSRIEQGRKQYEMESTDLELLVTETAKLMEAYGVERSILASVRISGEPVPVDADGRAIQQVLVNLIDNAIKHSPSRSTVTIELEFAPAHVSISVEDQGEGIPPEDHERIFEQFYRRGSELRRKTQGVGLGLAIVKSVVAAHGGTVRVRSAVGQGSRFTVTFPIKQEDLNEADAPHHSDT